MELRSLVHLVVKRWWLVLAAFVVTLGVAIGFTFTQAPRYSSSTTLVVAPSVELEDDALSALTVIARQTEITDTYAQIAASGTIQDAAADALQLAPEDRADTQLASRLVTGTTLLEISTTASTPELASDYANAVADSLVEYVAANFGIFEVSVLDTGGISADPVSPDVPLNLALGIGAGLLLGVGLAIVAHLLTPPARAGLRDIVDADTWAFNDSFFAYRLGQEMNRSRRSRLPTSVALIDVNHEGALDDLLPRARQEALRRMATLLDSHLRPEDIVARLYGTVFAVILPDTNEPQAVAMVESLRSRVGAPALGTTGNGAPVHANPAAGVVEFTDGTTDVMQHAQTALRAAKEGPIGRTEAFSALSALPGT